MTNTEITYTETWQTEPGPYGECKQYELEANIQHITDGEDAGNSGIRVRGTIYTIGVGGAVMSADPYEDYDVEWLEGDELDRVDVSRLRESIELSFGASAPATRFERPNGEVVYRFL